MTATKRAATFSTSWTDFVSKGNLATTFELTAPIQIAGKTLVPGTQIQVGLSLEGRDFCEWARVVDGEHIESSMKARRVGTFIIQWNEIRKLKPGAPKELRIGRQPDFASPGIEGCRFECEFARTKMSLLLRETVMREVRLQHLCWNVYPNASFFEKRGHGMLIPVEVVEGQTSLPHFPQRLTRQFLVDCVQFLTMNDDVLGFFNAIHAGASVDHIHFQIVHHAEELALEKASTILHHGARMLGDHYPANGLVFDRDDVDAIGAFAQKCEESRVPFNLLFLRDRAFIIPRNRDHEVVREFPTGVLASMELAGMGITDSEDVFRSVTDEQIRRALHATTLSRSALEKLL